MLDIDLLLLRNPERFQNMCLRLARYEFPGAMPLQYASHDRGRDGMAMISAGVDPVRGVVFQCKFVAHPSRAKRQVLQSLDALRGAPFEVSEWILCLPVDPTAVFADWLALEARKRQCRPTIWGRSELLRRLEEHPDVVDAFFRGVAAELSRYFRSASLELFQVKLDPTCQWLQPDSGVLAYHTDGTHSPDLVLDLVVRNTGTMATALTAIEAEVFDWRIKPHGIPEQGLLLPQVEYAVSIHGGEPGTHRAECEPPLMVAAGALARFKVRLVDAGYGWNGAIRLTLTAGTDERLALPAMRLAT